MQGCSSVRAAYRLRNVENAMDNVMHCGNGKCNVLSWRIVYLQNVYNPLIERMGIFQNCDTCLVYKFKKLLNVLKYWNSYVLSVSIFKHL